MRASFGSGGLCVNDHYAKARLATQVGNEITKLGVRQTNCPPEETLSKQQLRD